MNIEHTRHTLAHLLGAAVLELYPDAKLTIGPAIDNGFYYDFEFSTPFSDTELPKVEKKMRSLLPSWKEFSHREVSKDEALALYKDNVYKTELVNGIESAITLYTAGKFTDLCRGGHLDNPAKEIAEGSFKLTKSAGAYWRGDEKNKMLTRIYGLAFETKAELEAYEKQIEDAKARDHKKLGKELGLFTFSDLVGAGLSLWTPKGTQLRESLIDYVWSLRKPYGYQKVTIPHITKKALYETSGHWAKYADDLFKIETREKHVYAMKPMNCPHHTQIFDSEPRTYKQMPQRYCETTMVYRDEQSGELSGLARVLAITQDDAHVFCRENQIQTEVDHVWNIIQTFYKTFGFELAVRLSRRDPQNPGKYMGEVETWNRAEQTLKDFVEKKGVTWIDGVGEAAFYGPKLDFMAKDSLGREWQVATIQLDFVQPTNFKLTCTNEKGEKEPVVMIHCAVTGSIERLLAILIEHYAGNFPLWLSPVQVAVIPVRENHNAAAKELSEKLLALDIRTQLMDDDENLGKKIRAVKNQKTPYTIIIGDKDIEAGKITLESRDHGQVGQLDAAEVIERIAREIKEKK